MTSRPQLEDGATSLYHLLNAVEDAPPVAAVDVVAEELLASVGALQVTFFITDFSGEQLVRLAQRGATEVTIGEESETEPIVGSCAGEALRRQVVQIEKKYGLTWTFVPVTARGEAVGVLEIVLPDDAAPEVITEVSAVAHALAYIIIVNRRHTDLFEWGQRSAPMTLAAEIQRRLIPSAATCEAGQFTLAGWLEPSSQVAGDTYDYSLERDQLSVSMTDAMGHSVHASLLAVIAVSAIRSARRQGRGVAARAETANAALRKYASRDEFVTGQLMTVDLLNGVASFVNAGHPLPYLARDGQVNMIDLEADVPFGMFDAPYRVQTLDLFKGDRLVLVTDGMFERNTANIDIAPMIQGLSQAHPREVVQHLCQQVAKDAGGSLNDDATVLCVDWHGAGSSSRITRSGSNETGASA